MEEDTTIQGFAGYLDETKSVNNGLCLDSCPTITSVGMVNNGQIFNGSDTGIDVSANAIFDFAESNSFTIQKTALREYPPDFQTLIIQRK